MVVSAVDIEVKHLSAFSHIILCCACMSIPVGSDHVLHRRVLTLRSTLRVGFGKKNGAIFRYACDFYVGKELYHHLSLTPVAEATHAAAGRPETLIFTLFSFTGIAST